MFAKIIFQFFLQGGPVMWPILISALVAVAVVGERAFWWWREGQKRDPQKLEQIFAALENSDVATAQKLAEGSEDPLIRVIRQASPTWGTRMARCWARCNCPPASNSNAPGVSSPSMDTLVTLAPLLGLLGTVTGLMRAFLHIGSAELSVTGVTGGIGEALSATACGLGIAIFCLIPFNYFTGRVVRLQFELETAATNVEVLVGGGAKTGDTVHLHKHSPPGQATSH